MANSTAVVAGAAPLEIAEAWMEAFETGDVAAFIGLMHPDATANCLNCGYSREETAYFGPFAEEAADTSSSRLLALGNGTLNAVCTADGPVVACETLWVTDFGYSTPDGERTQQLRATYDFTIDDGVITRRIMTINEGRAHDPGKVAAYGTWLRDTYPEAHAEGFAFGTILLTTVEQFGLHREYVRQYWASR